MKTDACEDAEFTRIHVHRVPDMDAFYKGKFEADWYDLETRKQLCSLGWYCMEHDYETCGACLAKEECSVWEDYEAEQEENDD